MIAVFLMTVGTTMAALVLTSLWVTRREQNTGLRRLIGRKPSPRQPSRAAATPVLRQAEDEEHGRMAQGLLSRSNCGRAPSVYWRPRI